MPLLERLSVCHWQSSQESFLNASSAGRQVQRREGNGRASLKPVPVLSGPVCIKRLPLSDRSNGQKAMSCELSPSIPQSPLRHCTHRTCGRVDRGRSEYTFSAIGTGEAERHIGITREAETRRAARRSGLAQ